MESIHISLISGSQSTTFTFKNNCPYPVWPGVLTGQGSAPSTGFELVSRASSSIVISAPWSGRFWGRTFCSTNSGSFKCLTGDCGSGQVACNGAGAIPPASLVELTLATNGGKDFYDISLVDGYNLPVSIAPQGGSDCSAVSCPANINSVCPSELSFTAPDGQVIGCRSACDKFKDPKYCCTGSYGSPSTCPPTNYSMFFKNQCPQAYSYAYDDKTSTFTCTGSNYLITFCP
ncbi:PREDICTED: thaumatin-like protein 1 [Nelumbo nucifera]|uniref:Thaumatin-like protein 1 n=1 Tax=Nelumbo nucifera TaxID=4432 RepID=A0A1U7Z8A9_NELNU|nr:PREDICTED: thaumatin-like protein 1 [Nelumbo nucifera]